jgi:ATP-dependent exoDNAse (exonuclease V) beta subunit
MPSILIDSEFDDTIDIRPIKSVSQLALDNQTKTPDDVTRDYYKSIVSQNFTAYDGDGVQGLDATHLSASQINKYISCPLAYLYSNKVRVQAPKQSEEGFDVMEQGSLMHLCYEFFGKYIKQNSIKSTDTNELYEIMYKISFEAYQDEKTTKNRGDENIHHKIFLSTLQAGLKDDRSAGLLAKFVDYYIEKADKFEYFQNTNFEKEFALDSELKPYILQNKDDKNYFIKGVIDRFDNLENQVNIIDYKSKKITSITGKHTETQEKIDELKDVQLALYMLYAKQEHPSKKHYSSMLSFKGDSKAAHFGELSNEMYDSEYEEKLKQIIFDTKDGIENGKFGFDNSDEKQCEWCDIKHICHESVLSYES